MSKNNQSIDTQSKHSIENLKTLIFNWLRSNGKKPTEEIVIHILTNLEQSLNLIEKEHNITCHWDRLDSYEQKRGKRVFLLYDGEHYFLMQMSDPNIGRVFAPCLDRESALKTFKELENNEDIQFENE